MGTGEVFPNADLEALRQYLIHEILQKSFAAVVFLQSVYKPSVTVL